MTWKDDLNYGLAAFGIRLPEKLPVDDWATQLTGQPARSTAAVVAASAVLFYLAERDRNPKVKDIFDALIYCSTCLSVGYGDIFAQTPAGKLLGSSLMTIGPALSGRALDGKAGDDPAKVQQEIHDALLAIVERLQAVTSTTT